MPDFSDAVTSKGNKFPPGWKPVRLPPQLMPGDVHVWAINLVVDSATLQSLEGNLCDEELDRAGRFHFDRDCMAYKVTRGRLRWLIACYQETEPARVRLVDGEYGKPALPGGDLRFNVSRSDKVGLLAFTRGRDVGVDIEWVRPVKLQDQLARFSFSEWEYEQYSQVPDTQKPAAFYHCWTQKEAYIKAIGMGLSFPLDAFDVTVNPSNRPQLLRVEGSTQKATQWKMQELASLDSYAAVVIAGGRKWQLSCFCLKGQ